MKKRFIALFSCLCFVFGGACEAAPAQGNITTDGEAFSHAIPEGFVKAGPNFASIMQALPENSIMYVPKETDDDAKDKLVILNRYILTMPVPTGGKRLNAKDFEDYKKGMVEEFGKQGKKELVFGKGVSIEEAVMAAVRAGHEGLFRVVMQSDTEFLTTVLYTNKHKPKDVDCYNVLLIATSYRVDGKVLIIADVHNITSPDVILPLEKAAIPILKAMAPKKAAQ